MNNKNIAKKRKNFHSKIRPSYYNQAKHFSDAYVNLGYDYTGKILQQMTSPELWANPIQKPLFFKIEGIINFLIEQVKYVKKTMSIAHDKETLNIN